MTSDIRLSEAVTHWAPRFILQGVDYNDFIRTTQRIQCWEAWLDAWKELGDMHRALGEEAEARGHRLTAGEAYVRAAVAYHFAKFLWWVEPAKRWHVADLSVHTLYRAHRLLDPTAERVEVPFEGSYLVGNLRRPKDVERPPLVILIPGLDSTKEEFFHWENTFLVRGIATFSIEGPGQGEIARHLPIRPDYEVVLAAFEPVIRSRPDMDADRIAAVGVSLGGYYVLRAAAFTPWVKVVVALGGPYDFGACWARLPRLTREMFVRCSGAKNEAEGITRAQALSLAGILHRVHQPALIVFGKQDRLFPYQHAEQVAAELPNGELVMYPEGNHTCTNIPYKSRPFIADWVATRVRHVG